MPEFRYYAIHNDVWQWIDELAELGGYRFVLDKPYFEPMPIEFDSLSKLEAGQFETARGIFILSSRYSRYPLVLDGPFESQDAQRPWYAFLGRRGGPAIRVNISPVGTFLEHLNLSHKVVNFAAMTYQSLYSDPTEEYWFKPSDELKDAYANLRKLIRSRSVKRWVNFGDSQEAHWFGEQTIKLIESDELFILGVNEAIGANRLSAA